MIAEGWHILSHLHFDQPEVSLNHVTGVDQVVYLADIGYYKSHGFFYAFFDLSRLSPSYNRQGFFKLLSPESSARVNTMQFSPLLLAAFAATIEGSSFILGDFIVLNPITLSIDAQPRVWFNFGEGVTPDSNILELGKITGNRGTGLLCAEQDCPLGFSVGACTGWLKSADGESAIIHAIGPGFDVENMVCFKDHGYSAGGIAKSGRIKSFYRCSLGSEVQCT